MKRNGIRKIENSMDMTLFDFIHNFEPRHSTSNQYSQPCLKLAVQAVNTVEEINKAGHQNPTVLGAVPGAASTSNHSLLSVLETVIPVLKLG